jgi:nucleoside-diphosphate kinase
MEKTLVIIKPDALQNRWAGKIIAIFEDMALEIIQAEMMMMSDEMLEEHYSHLVDKDFFPEIVEFMQSLPVLVMTLQGNNAVSNVRNEVGATDPNKADKGTIREQFGTDVMWNAVHASDSVENAEAEITRFFG